MKRKKLVAIIFSCIAFLVIVSVVIVTISVLRKQQNVLPKDVLNSANFTLFVPQQDHKSDDAWNLVTLSAGYDKSSGVLSSSYKQTSSDTTITLTEQSTPDAFNDVPQQYTHVLDALNEYAEIQTSFGTIGLTHPTELKGGQTAVVNKSGTLMFAKPSANLTNEQWKQFFNTLQIIR